MYTVIYHDWNPDENISRAEIYQWITIFILVMAMFYFLWQSLTFSGKQRLKNPNELYSYLALGIINNSVFFAKLCYYATHIKRDWLDSNVTPAGSPDNLMELTKALFSLTIICLAGVVVIVVFMALTAKPLRDYIFKEIFYDIGANVNSV